MTISTATLITASILFVKPHGLSSINLLGICQGGTFSLCYSALYPEKVKNLVVMVPPVNFSHEQLAVKSVGGVHVGCRGARCRFISKGSG